MKGMERAGLRYRGLGGAAAESGMRTERPVSDEKERVFL